MSEVIEIKSGQKVLSLNDLAEDIIKEIKSGDYNSGIVILTGPRSKYVNSSNHTMASYLYVLEVEAHSHLTRIV